jgi:hypothetical protein
VVDHLLERSAQASALLIQKAGPIVIQCKGRSHIMTIGLMPS